MKELAAYLEKEREKRSFPGAVVGVWQAGKQEIVTVGCQTYDSQSAAVTADTLYDVASVTKVIPTACLAIVLAREGYFGFDDLVIGHIPDFSPSHRDEITVGHLIRQELDYKVQLSSLKHLTADEMLQAIYRSELKSPPATRVFHANASSILLTEVIRQTTGQELDVLAESYFFQPLNMRRTTFHPQEAVPTEYDHWRGRVVQAEVHDESAALLREKMVVGSAGLFSTVPDLLSFLSAILQGTLFQENDIKLMESGYGWEVNRPDFMGSGASQHTIAKRGFTGCMVLWDRTQQLAVAMLTNSTYPKRRPVAEHQDLNERLRREVMDIIWKSL